MANEANISFLIRQYLDKKATERELLELAELLLDEHAEDDIQAELDGIISGTAPLPDYSRERWEGLYQKIAAQRAVPVRKINWRRWSAAAAVVILLATAITFFVNRFYNGHEHTLAADRFKNDVAPGTNKAILTLGNGQKIVLDSAATGELARQGQVKIIKVDSGALRYLSPAASNAETISYNTLSAPRGGQYQLTLPDGSRVWLNAASSIHYPTAFTGDERRVEITGEVYFEVAKNPSKPFRVAFRGGETEVLGTHFNINAYDDEPEIKTTLLEGSIRVDSKGKEGLVIKPGEQAILADNKIKLLTDVDMDKVMAWKQGRFVFSGDDLRYIMRQIGRWYNVEVSYEGIVPDMHFSGIVNRSNKVSAVLTMLESTGNIRFRIEGNKIIVMT